MDISATNKLDSNSWIDIKTSRGEFNASRNTIKYKM